MTTNANILSNKNETTNTNVLSNKNLKVLVLIYIWEKEQQMLRLYVRCLVVRPNRFFLPTLPNLNDSGKSLTQEIQNN